MSASDIEWDEAIYYTSFSYNTSVHSSTKFTPAYLMFGRELSFPLELLTGIPQIENNLPHKIMLKKLRLI